MFNTISQKTTINNPANGIIQKSNEKSFFLNFHNKSSLADGILSEEPNYGRKGVSVLQILLMSNDWLLCEIVYSDDL